MALLLAAVFLSSAAAATAATPAPGVSPPDIRWMWAVGGVSLAVFFVSESRTARELVPFARSHTSRLRRLQARGLELRSRIDHLPAPGEYITLADLGSLDRDLAKWGEDCGKFASHDLDDPRFRLQVGGETWRAKPRFFRNILETYHRERAELLDSYIEAAHSEDRG